MSWMSSGSGSSKSFPSLPFDFLQLFPSLSRGLDEEDFLVLNEWAREDGEAKKTKEIGVE